MNKTVTAAEANRSFSKLLKEVKKGHKVIVTSHGEPVATIDAIERVDTATRDKAWKAFLEELRKRPAMNSGPWTREELYEDDPE